MISPNHQFNRLPARLLQAIGVLLLLSACALGGRPAPVSVLAPAPALPELATTPSVDWSIQIQRPVADQMRDSDRVLVRRSPSRLQVYPQALWLDNVPDMLQSLMVQGFADSDRFAAAGRAGGLRTRFALASEVRNFELVDDGQGRRAEIVLQVNLVHLRTGMAMAGETFRAQAALAALDPDAVVLAFESALSDLLPELMSWSVSAGLDSESRLEQIRDRWRER